jgi:hypothetical protein
MKNPALTPDERLHRAHDRTSLLGAMLGATASGDFLSLTDVELRALAGYLEDIRDDLGIVQGAVCSFHTTGRACPRCSLPRAAGAQS